MTVPVNIDTARPAGSSGLMEATLALRYNPQVFSVTAADIKLGTVPTPAAVGSLAWRSIPRPAKSASLSSARRPFRARPAAAW